MSQLASNCDTAMTRFLDLDGDVIAYRLVGRGDALVLLHRFRASMDDWDPALIDALAQDAQVVMCDSAGVGQSTGDALSTVEATADVAAAVTRARGFSRADFLGWSLGGMVGQALALRHPDLVRALVLAGTTPPAGTAEVVTSSPEWTLLQARQA